MTLPSGRGRPVGPDESDGFSPREPVRATMRRFVVFRRYEAVETWYVEAETARSARERVFPDDPSDDPYFGDRGGCEPTDSAVVRELATIAREIRRFPAGITIFFGQPGTERNAGSNGEPPRRRAP